MADRDKSKSNQQGDSEEELERALDRGPRPDLLGDIEENRNLSGSTTYETLPEFGGEGEGGQSGSRSDESQR